MNSLSEAEQEALDLLRHNGGAILITAVPDKTERDMVMGTIIPGITIFRKLEKKGLVYFTDESEAPFDDMPDFRFTEMICLS